MVSSGTKNSRAGGRWIGILLFTFAVSLLASSPALPQTIDCVGDAGGIVDGFVNYPVPPSQINIHGPCSIRN